MAPGRKPVYCFSRVKFRFLGTKMASKQQNHLTYINQTLRFHTYILTTHLNTHTHIHIYTTHTHDYHIIHTYYRTTKPHIAQFHLLIRYP